MLSIYSLMMRGLYTMDKYIIINLNMFARENQVFIVAPNEDMVQVGAYTIEDLPKIVTDLAHSSDIYNSCNDKNRTNLGFDCKNTYLIVQKLLEIISMQ